MTATPAVRTVGELVEQRVESLQKGYTSTVRQDPEAVAALARLRRGVGKSPGDVIDVLEYTLLPADVPQPRQDAATPQEWAVHVAMTLFAVHQQSRGERMHRRGTGLGTALRSLHTGDSRALPDPLVRRFRMLGTADSFAELSHHLRGVVQLLRAGRAPLDYALLADQLLAWQRFGPDRVQLRWGREFYRTERSTDPTPDPASD